MHLVLDRLDREDIRLHHPRYLTLLLLVYEGMWTHSPLSLLCITMILCVRRIFFEITTFPNSGIRARFYALMLCTSRTQRSCGRGYIHIACRH